MDTWKDEILDVRATMDITGKILEAKNLSSILGCYLKIPNYIVDRIHLQYSKPADCLYYVIEAFLKQAEPRPTWRAILDALTSRIIYLPHLVEEIERHHSAAQSAIQGNYKNHFTD